MKLPRMPAAVVFDMDGLLFDTEVLYQEAIQLAAAEAGHEVAVDVFNRTVGLPWAQCRTLLLSDAVRHKAAATRVDSSSIIRTVPTSPDPRRKATSWS